jgi:7-cyano-7-deazaguanine synthase
MQQVAHVGTKIKTDINNCAPLIEVNKTEVVKQGMQLHVPFELTWSCHNYVDVACGQCSNCLARLQAFKANQSMDPVPHRGTKS